MVQASRIDGWVLALVLGVGCRSDAVGVGATGGGTTGGTTASTSGASTGDSSGGATTGTTSSTTTSDASGVVDTSSDGGPIGTGFLMEPDVGSIHECDIWAQDCVAGHKCMPYSNDGSASWNDVRCSPVVDDPRQVGETCTVDGSGVSGLDDCDHGSMCWDVDPRTELGECVAFCQGTELNSICADPCDHCWIPGNGVTILCLPGCDPIAPDCPMTQACLPLQGDFGCLPDASGDEGQVGDACQYINACDPGNYCADAVDVPGCDPREEGCCTAFCDVDAPDTCDALVPGTACVPILPDGEQPPCFATARIGGCMRPR